MKSVKEFEMNMYRNMKITLYTHGWRTKDVDSLVTLSALFYNTYLMSILSNVYDVMLR